MVRLLACAFLLLSAMLAIPQQLLRPFKVMSSHKSAKASFHDLKPNLRGRTPILTYHDIIERRDASSLWFDCSVDEFKQQLDWLKSQGATFITLDQLYDHLVNGTVLPRRAIAITFADGYLGFYDRAMPILRQRRIPTAMFVHTSMVGSKVGRPKMTWRQLLELQRSKLVTIGSQTVTHPADLRQLTDEQLYSEMANSKRDLIAHLGGFYQYVAYPNGKWDNRAVAAAKKALYFMGFTEELRPAEKASNILAVPRYVHTKYREAWRDAYGK